jgi:single-stranded-DNA-specific exonuclease
VSGTAAAPRYGVWVTPSVSRARVTELARALDVAPCIAAVLAARGLHEPARAAAFLDPRLSALSDPFAMPEMDRAVARIELALARRERIAVFGDYDVDGLTSATLVTKILRLLGADAEPFLPRRAPEGYGFTPAALTRCLAALHPSLLITVDCGTGASEAVALARQAGCDVIVTDHHQPVPVAEPVVADLNPKRFDDVALHSLAGVGVAFKLCHALVKSGRQRGCGRAQRTDLREWLDLVALGSVADMAPLTGETRVLVRFGLERMNRTRHRGLRALMDVAKVRVPVSTYDIGFALGPRLNAAGRMGDPDEALALLMADREDAVEELAHALDAANVRRRDLEKDMVAEAEARLQNEYDRSRHFGVALAADDWEPGVIGIVASRLCKALYRPVAVASFRDGALGRGSCRSIEAVDVLQALQQCGDLLEDCGGHRLAAGFSVTRRAWPAFREAFRTACRAQLDGVFPTPSLRVDAWLDDLDEVTDDLFGQLRRLAPFGQDNPAPVLGFRRLTLAGPPRLLSNGRHMKLAVRGGARQLDAVAFGMGARTAPNGEMDLAARLEQNHWRGATTLQLHVHDFRDAQEDTP